MVHIVYQKMMTIKNVIVSKSLKNIQLFGTEKRKR